MLAECHGEKRRYDRHADTDTQTRSGCSLCIQRGALAQTITDTNGDGSSQRHRQDEH